MLLLHSKCNCFLYSCYANFSYLQDEIEFVMEELKMIRSFNLTKDNWTIVLSMMNSLYDFMEGLCEHGGNLKLIHVLRKIIFDDRSVEDNIGKEPCLKWTTPRVTFLSMMTLKNGFSHGTLPADVYQSGLSGHVLRLKLLLLLC